MLDSNCGKVIGVNRIVYLCDCRDTDGHKLYHTKCVVCGFETNKRLSNIKKNTACHHTIKTQSPTPHYATHTSYIKDRALQSVFRQIKQRCYNPNNNDYKHYGVKGIKVCKEWEENPESFEQWAFKTGYKRGLSIDRVDADKDYCPENCRWITLQDNARYKSTTRTIKVNGIEKSGRQWAERLGFGPNYINTMVRKKGMQATVDFIKSKI